MVRKTGDGNCESGPSLTARKIESQRGEKNGQRESEDKQRDLRYSAESNARPLYRNGVCRGSIDLVVHSRNPDLVGNEIRI